MPPLYDAMVFVEVRENYKGSCLASMQAPERIAISTPFVRKV